MSLLRLAGKALKLAKKAAPAVSEGLRAAGKRKAAGALDEIRDLSRK